MSDPRPKEMIRATNLIFNGKVDEWQEILKKYESKSEITPEEQVWIFIFRGWDYLYNTFQIQKAIDMGDRSFKLSQELGLIAATIEALILKAHAFLLGEFDEGQENILEAENLINNPANWKGDKFYDK